MTALIELPTSKPFPIHPDAQVVRAPQGIPVSILTLATLAGIAIGAIGTRQIQGARRYRELFG